MRMMLTSLGFGLLPALLPAAAAPPAVGQTTVAATPSQPAVPKIPTINPWFELEPFQETMTREEFEQKLTEIFDPYGMMEPYMEITDEQVVFYPTQDRDTRPQFTLRFAPNLSERRETPRFFRTPHELRNKPKPPGKPLHGLRVALDPGHIGGDWARLEERSVKYRGQGPVQEGDHNLLAARLIRQRLEALGAEVFLVRDDSNPVTPHRPKDFVEDARMILYEKFPKLEKKYEHLPLEEQYKKLGRKHARLAEILFYRGSDIEERGAKISNEFPPDVTISLHFNATANSGRGRLTPKNRNVFFVHGSYLPSEVRIPTQRQRMVYKILEESNDVEIEVAKAIADEFAEKTGYPPVLYGNSLTTREVIDGYKDVVARNLAANRLYDGPVVFTEPYLMNHNATFRRLLAGDYDGMREFAGKQYRSIYQEYADAVTSGLLDVYGPQDFQRSGTPETAEIESTSSSEESPRESGL